LRLIFTIPLKIKMNSPKLKEVICLEVFKSIVEALHEREFGDNRRSTSVDAFKPNKNWICILISFVKLEPSDIYLRLFAYFYLIKYCCILSCLFSWKFSKKLCFFNDSISYLYQLPILRYECLFIRIIIFELQTSKK